LPVVVIAANPHLSKVYFKGKYVKGSSDEPLCRSSDGVRPDGDVAEKQNANCASCPQNQWGSKISEFSGKEIKACADKKQLAVLPAQDSTFRALGFTISGGSLGDWGKYVQALSGRGYPVNELVTNITFDATANGVLNFGFNRFLTDDEAAKFKLRANGDDVKAIVAPVRALALPAPEQFQQLAPPVAAPTPAAFAPPVQPAPVSTAPVQPAPVDVAPAAMTGFGAAPVAQSAPPAEPAKRTRKPRAVAPVQPAGPGIDLSYLDPAIRAAVEALGVDSPAGKSLLAQFPPPATAPTQPANVTGNFVAPPQVVADPVPAPAPVTSGFGAAAAPAAPIYGAAIVASPAVVSSAASLKDRLQALLGGKG